MQEQQYNRTKMNGSFAIAITYNRKHDCIDNCKNRKQVITVDKAIEIAIVNAVAKSGCNIDKRTYNCKNNSITEQK